MRIRPADYALKKKEQDRKYRLNKLSDPGWVEKERERSRLKMAAYRARGLYRNTKSDPNKDAWKARNPIKVAAHLKARCLNKLNPGKCCECGKLTNQLHKHHPDYNQPLSVLWLCYKCHYALHRKVA